MKSKNTYIIIVAIVVILTVVMMAQNTNAPAQTDAPGDTNVSAPAPETPEMVEEDTLEVAPTPAPSTPTAPHTTGADVDAVLQNLDEALADESYETENVTELFNESSDESLTQPYEI